MEFVLEQKDTSTKARTGKLSLAHGDVLTPVFMPVGTQGVVKGMTPKDLDDLGTQIILSNTYHLFLRPGCEVISKAGTLHKFIGWNKPILTDSGGYQVYSLADLRKLNDDGVVFRSHIDGTSFIFTPENVIEAQEGFGVDIMMQLDECPPSGATKNKIEEAVDRSILWAKRSVDKWSSTTSNLFAIVQGGLHYDLRQKSAEKLIEIDFPGYALGGFSVGEEMTKAYPIIEKTAEFLPQDKPRYLMGIGFPEDIVKAVSSGIDMFDCVLPTRCARTGMCFYSEGRLRIKNARYKKDMSPIDLYCTCYTCRNFSRSYLRHLFMANEITAVMLMTIHNIHFYLDLCKKMRRSIQNNSFNNFYKNFFDTLIYL